MPFLSLLFVSLDHWYAVMSYLLPYIMETKVFLRCEERNRRVNSICQDALIVFGSLAPPVKFVLKERQRNFAMDTCWDVKHKFLFPLGLSNQSLPG